ncbi:MAG: FxsA family protein [Planctomycetaceae bacterium]
MIGRLLILFLVVPLVELYLLLRFADATGIAATIALVVLTGICGTMLASRQSVAAYRNFQMAISQGRVPGAEVVDGILIAVAAAMLLAPGLLTDLSGILLLIPWTRTRLRQWMIRRYASRFKVVTFSPGFGAGGFGDDGDTIDGSFRRSGGDDAARPSVPRVDHRAG